MKKKTEAFSVAQSISTALCSDQWMSTQTTANCLVAMARFAGKEIKSNGQNKFRLAVNGKPQDISIDKGTYSKEFPDFEGKLSLNIENQSAADLYVTIIQRGIPQNANVPARQNGIKLDVVYLKSDGNPVDVTNIPKGSDFTAVVRVKNTGFGEVDNLVLTQIFPSGWEILNERLFGSETVARFNYRDIRDDRVFTYFGLKMNEQKEFRVKLNATYSGTYFLPPVQVEAMYNNTVSANNSGMKVVVGK